MSFVLLLSVLIVKVGDVFVSRASRMSLRGLNEKCLVSRVARAWIVYRTGVGPLEPWFLPSYFLIFLQNLSTMQQGYLQA